MTVTMTSIQRRSTIYSFFITLIFLPSVTPWLTNRRYEKKESVTRELKGGLCLSNNPSYEHMLQLSEEVIFYWSLVSGDLLKAQILYEGIGWVGFGVAEDENGSMIGSDAIIGQPASEMSALKFDLDSKSGSGVVPMETDMQTLIDSSALQDHNSTVLKFTKLLKEDGEIEILPEGKNTFLWAVGSSNTLGHHKDRGAFNLDLTNCVDLTDETNSPAMISGSSTTSKSGLNMRAFIAHGILAGLAWTVAAPFAIATAWFRRLVPIGWIYMHVIANVFNFFFTLVACIIAVVGVTRSPEHISHFSNSHHIVGICMMFLVTIQILGGFMRPPIDKTNTVEGDDGSKYEEPVEKACGCIPAGPRAVWHAGHKCIGLTLFLMSVFQIQSGLKLFSDNFGTPSMLPLYWATVVIFFMSVLVIMFTMMCNLRSKNDATLDKSRKMFATLDEMEFKNPHEDVIDTDSRKMSLALA